MFAVQQFSRCDSQHTLLSVTGTIKSNQLCVTQLNLVVFCKHDACISAEGEELNNFSKCYEKIVIYMQCRIQLARLFLFAVFISSF